MTLKRLIKIITAPYLIIEAFWAFDMNEGLR